MTDIIAPTSYEGVEPYRKGLQGYCKIGTIFMAPQDLGLGFLQEGGVGDDLLDRSCKLSHLLIHFCKEGLNFCLDTPVEDLLSLCVRFITFLLFLEEFLENFVHLSTATTRPRISPSTFQPSKSCFTQPQPRRASREEARPRFAAAFVPLPLPGSA